MNGSCAMTVMPNAAARAATSKADDPERLAVQFVSDERLAFPQAGVHARVRLRYVPHRREQQGKRQLRGGERISARCVYYHDARGGRGLDVDCINTHAGACYHLEVRRRREQRGVDARFRADDQPARLTERFVQRLARTAHDGNDFGTGLTQNGNTAFVKRLSDDDAT
jgi:hypothetical protein